EHARADGAGQIAFFRAHATALPIVVRRTPRSAASSASASVRPACTPGNRWTGTTLPAPHAHGRSIAVLARALLEGRREVAHRCRRPEASEGPRPFPLQAALVPDVHVGAEDESDEDDHLDQLEQTAPAESHGPREEK